MSKQQEYARITISLSPKLNTQIRLETVRAGISLSEMVEKYREAWLRELKKEIALKKAERENKQCSQCGQLIIN